MFKTLKTFMLKFVRNYHHHMVTYYDHKSYRRRNMGYCGMCYEDEAWKHLDKELKINNKLKQLGV